MNTKEIFDAVTAIGTAAAAVFIACQLWIMRRQFRTSFEDKFNREYRKLAQKLPTKALLGDELTEEEHKKAFRKFYHYFDLSNEQVFHRKINRVSKPTWKFWRDGIQSNLKLKAFAKAWKEIEERNNGDFRELRSLIQDFKADPRKRWWEASPKTLTS
jgi:hypothetical protein